MSKERVQAKLAFNGCLKPLESKAARAQTSKEAEIVVLECQQRAHEGGIAPKKPASEKKRSRSALQQGGSSRAGPAQAMQSSAVPSTKAERSKPFVDMTSPSEDKVIEPNPVFALAARRRVAEANRSVRSRSALVDVTAGPIQTHSVRPPPTLEVSRSFCQLSECVPPVHILQGSPFGAAEDCNQSGRKRRLSRLSNATIASTECTGSLHEHLQQEVMRSSVSAEVSKLLNDSIADFLWEDASARADAVEDASTSHKSASLSNTSEPPDSPITYVQAVLSHAGFQAYACDPTSAMRWHKQITLMMGNSADLSSNQLPWTAKYAPQASDQVLANSSSSARLRQWLSREQADEPGPTETESCAASSWKADSEDSEFIESKANKRCNGPGGMLLTGPHGSGKSAAVCACAQELHMNVLEISPGMERSGGNLVKLVGEATQSHTVICKGTPLEEINQPNQGDLTACKQAGKLPKRGVAKKKAVRQSKTAKNSVPPPEQRCLTGAIHSASAQMKDQSVARSRSLLLFEDFDQLLDQEDEGFISSLSTLLLESKIPVLLLSESPDAEDLLHRAVAGGAKLQSARTYAPPLRCILEYLALVCVCERVAALPAALMQLACACNGDLRSALNQLQFLIEHCSTIQTVSEESLGEHSWKGCKWTVIDPQLTAPGPLSAQYRAQAWQAQPNSMVWGLHEPQCSMMQAGVLSGDSGAAEWAFSLLVDHMLGASLKKSAEERVDSLQPAPNAAALCEGNEKEHLHDAKALQRHSQCVPSRPAEARASSCMNGVVQYQELMQQCEREGGRILATWVEHLRLKQSRSMKQQKRRRNGSGNAAQLQPGVRKRCKVAAADIEEQENPATGTSVALSGAADLQDDDHVHSMGEGHELSTAPSRCVLDDEDGPAGACAGDLHDQMKSSTSAIHLPNTTDDEDEHAMHVDNVTAVDSAPSTDQANPADASVMNARLSPNDVPSAPDEAMVDDPCGLPAEQGNEQGDAPAKSLQQTVQLNDPTSVMKQAEIAQKLHIQHLLELADGMRSAGTSVDENCKESHQKRVCHAEASQSDTKEPISVQQVSITDLDAVVRASEAASALEALSGRCSNLLDQQAASASAGDSMWTEPHGVNGAACSTGKDAALPVPSAAARAQSSCSGATPGAGAGVHSAQMSAVLEGVNEAALVCFADKGKCSEAGCGSSMQQAVKQSVPFRRGSRLCGANIVQDIRRILHCDTHASTVISARSVITMAASECPVANKHEDKLQGYCARRSRRQRQRGHCEEFLQKFDFSLSQFVDAQLASSLHI